MRDHLIPSRPHVQGSPSPLRLRHSAKNLTGGAGLLLLRRLWDQLELGRAADEHASWLGGVYRPGLMIEIWVCLLLYGGGCMDHLVLLGERGIRRLFGWERIPHPATFGRWLRRGGERLAGVIDGICWQAVQARWARAGVPRAVMLVLDSTVAVRYGQKQAGAETGYNPKKPGRPSHHPLAAFLAGTGDCMGVVWRPGNANTAAGAIPWLRTLVQRLKAAGVQQITVRLDKGFFSQEMVRALDALDEPGVLEVRYVLKMPDSPWIRSFLPARRRSARDPRLWTAAGRLYGARLLSVEQRREAGTGAGGLALDCYEVVKRAHVLTSVPGIQAVTGWRLYNQGARIEQRIEELGQLSAGETAVDDLGGNHLLRAMAALAYQLLHIMRTTAFRGRWRRAQPESIRAWFFRLPGKLTVHSRKHYVQLQRGSPLRRPFLDALRRLGTGPPLPV